VLVPGFVGFHQKGQGIVDPGQLSGLAHLSLVGLVGPLDDGLPDVSGERLIRVCRFRQLATYPFFCDFLISVDSVIYVPSAFRQGLIGLFNLPRSTVGSVIGVTTQLREPL